MKRNLKKIINQCFKFLYALTMGHNSKEKTHTQKKSMFSKYLNPKSYVKKSKLSDEFIHKKNEKEFQKNKTN